MIISRFLGDRAIDFRRLLMELRREYGSINRLAREMEYKNPDYLRKLMNGDITEPPFTVGVTLVGHYAMKVAGPIPRVGDKRENLHPRP